MSQEYGQWSQEQLSKYWNGRLRLCRFECPFIHDIKFIRSRDLHVKVPNGFELIEGNLNEGSLRAELKRLRSQTSKKGSIEPPQPAAEAKKPAAPKKGEQAVAAAKPGGKGAQPTPQELEQIKHEYVFMVVKRSRETNGAVYDVKVALAPENQASGPKDLFEQGYECKKIPIDQYPGVRETNRMAPCTYRAGEIAVQTRGVESKSWASVKPE